MKHPYQNSHFCKLLKQYLDEQNLTQEQLASRARISRESMNRTVNGVIKPSSRFVGAIAFICCLSPHDARTFFRAGGIDLDSTFPHFQIVRTVIDVPHDPNDMDAVEQGLNTLASVGFANPDRDGI